MKLFFVIFGLSSVHLSQCGQEPGPFSEDMRVLNETIAKYGLPQDYKQLGFPGPKIALDDEKYTYNNKLEYEDESENYTLRIRTITPNFSYIGNYEEVKMPETFNQFPEIKGQVGEHFERKSGGFYIRTIGYKVDENGYRPFLLDLSIANTIMKEEDRKEDSKSPITFCGVDYIFKSTLGGGGGYSASFGDRYGGGVSGPPSKKITISSTVIATLTGGNALG
ncbi:uncharacterized protein LOC123013578 isoform X1 [Tribolium madens]|uniref:uncharacterized protein LOC123013578 isoform X1 n=1 Tax=Tribolium madens TaxID=41895 RepID=UPI001CF73100|nr:uncharacterized protein LOC123013578 isoform X1 [Tribolium madens]